MKKEIIIGATITVLLGGIIGIVIKNDNVEIISGAWEFNQDNIVQAISKGIESYENSKIKKYIDIIPIIDNNKDDTLKLVNKNNNLSSNFVPKQIVKPKVRVTSGSITISNEIDKPLSDMFNQAENDGIKLYLLSGYRSYSTQKSIYSSKPSWKRGLYSAKEGESEHQLGLAVDITSQEVNLKLLVNFENTKSGKWLKDNAHKYGFIMRYTKGREADTGYAYEPWHYRYVGVEVASFMYENNLILEDLYKGI
ncbi:MAG: M15 family metallopeptidase [Clostridium sp.]